MAAVEYSSVSASDALEFRREPSRPSFSRVSSLPADDITAWVREKFPSLPLDDAVDASYSCALVKGILLQGRIYVTKTAILFHAKIFGRVTKEHLPLTSIRSVRKRKSGFIANAIKVTFVDPDAPPIVFGSLNRRERACAFIMARLLEVNPDAEAPREGEEDWSAEEFENTSRCIPQSRASSEDHFRSKSVPSSGSGIHDQNAGELDGGVDVEGTYWNGPVGTGEGFGRAITDSVVSNAKASVSSLPGSRSGSIVGDERGEEVPTGLEAGVDFARSTDSRSAHVRREGLWKVDDDVVDRLSGYEHSKRKEQARRVIKAPIESVFDLLFAGDFILKVHQKNGNLDCSETEWERGDDGYMSRTLRFSRALGYRIGPKATRVVETHRYSFTSDGGAVVEFSGHNLDVPMGDSFRVESYIELKRTGENGSSTLIVASVAVHFTKSTMLRSKIETGALAETKNTMTRLLDLAERWVAAEQARTATCLESITSAPQALNGPLHSREGPAAPLPPSPLKRLRSTHMPSTDRAPSLSSSKQDSTVPKKCPGPLDELRSSPPQAGHDISSTFTDIPSRSANREQTLLGSHVSSDRAKDPPLLGNVNGMRILIVALLAVVSMLLLVCIVLLAQLQRDVRRIEHLAFLRQAEMSTSCSTAIDATVVGT